jgi:hypothetical protein
LTENEHAGARCFGVVSLFFGKTRKLEAGQEESGKLATYIQMKKDKTSNLQFSGSFE